MKFSDTLIESYRSLKGDSIQATKLLTTTSMSNNDINKLTDVPIHRLKEMRSSLGRKASKKV